LDTLLPKRSPAPTQTAPPPDEKPDERPQTVPIDAIEPNPVQPRRYFEETALQELAQSIRVNGIIQPIVLRKAGDRFQLVAGERRWRAARIAGLERVPAVVQEISDERLLEITLIENIQREDLNPIETATAFARLATELNMGAEEIGQRTGKDRATISNFMRLLQLPEAIQRHVAERKLTAGHARCLITIAEPEVQAKLSEKCIDGGWSVRRLEEAAKKIADRRKAPKLKDLDQLDMDPNVRAAVQEMERVLGTKVRIVGKAKKRGKIEIEYYSQDDLDRIYEAIVGQN
jgi:ParB family chromosome partitioning protein